jgi:hypothetical protein
MEFGQFRASARLQSSEHKAGASRGDHVLALQSLYAAQQRELLSLQIEGTAHSTRREAVAVYDDLTKTIFLPHSWKGETPADLSVLVHEMVHHLQNNARKK